MAPAQAAFTAMVQGIQAGESACIVELRARFDPGLRFLLGRFVRPVEASSLAQEVLRAVVQAIQGGELSEPARLPALVRTVARRILDETREGQAEGKKPVVPERRRPERHMERIAGAVLEAMPAEDQEVLRRYYLEKQSPERVCAEMNLSLERFRLLTAKAKREFEARLARRPIENQVRAARAAGNASAA